MDLNFFRRRAKTTPPEPSPSVDDSAAKAPRLLTDPTLRAAANSLHRTVGIGMCPPEDGFPCNPVSHITDLPFRALDVYVKQINSEKLSDLGRAALNHAFTGFLNLPEDQPLLREAYVKERKERFGLDFDPSVQRRFAGDKSLPRGRYFTLCDETGFDHGTLIGELRTYYNPKQAGGVILLDLTNPEDFEAASQFTSGQRQLLLVFRPLGELANLFIAQADKALAEKALEPLCGTLGSTNILVGLPLTVTKIHRERVIDLREPAVAYWFARTLSRLVWNVRGKFLPCFPERTPLEGFDEILPEILAQENGGGGVATAAGLFLRYAGADALIFPSARSDATVEAVDGKVLSSSGWNLVDYAGAAPPRLRSYHELGNQWPVLIGLRPWYDAPEDAEPIWYPDVKIVFNESGTATGSWRVTGLRRRWSAICWRWRAEYALDACLERLSASSIVTLDSWLETCAKQNEAGILGEWSQHLYEAICGQTKSAQWIGVQLQTVRAVERLAPVAKALEELLARVYQPNATALANTRSIYIPWQEKV
jgi:hypothetical protein